MRQSARFRVGTTTNREKARPLIPPCVFLRFGFGRLDFFRFPTQKTKYSRTVQSCVVCGVCGVLCLAHLAARHSNPQRSGHSSEQAARSFKSRHISPYSEAAEIEPKIRSSRAESASQIWAGLPLTFWQSCFLTSIPAKLKPPSAIDRDGHRRPHIV